MKNKFYKVAKGDYRFVAGDRHYVIEKENNKWFVYLFEDRHSSNLKPLYKFPTLRDVKNALSRTTKGV